MTIERAEEDRECRDMIEVVDDFDFPLCILSLDEARKQFLRHRTIIVLIFDGDGKVLLQKRDMGAEFYPGRWDVSLSGHVRAGESRTEAATRRLRRETGVRGNRLVHRLDMGASSTNNHQFTSVFSTICSDLDHGIRDLLERGRAMFVDSDELASLAENCRENLTPGLVLFVEKDLIFSASAVRD